MTEKGLVNQGKESRQKTIDKMSIESGKAYTYELEEGSGCLSDAQKVREKTQEKLDQ